jgi:hypothetical protein
LEGRSVKLRESCAHDAGLRHVVPTEEPVANGEASDGRAGRGDLAHLLLLSCVSRCVLGKKLRGIRGAGLVDDPAVSEEDCPIGPGREASLMGHHEHCGTPVGPLAQ